MIDFVIDYCLERISHLKLSVSDDLTAFGRCRVEGQIFELDALVALLRHIKNFNYESA